MTPSVAESVGNVTQYMLLRRASPFPLRSFMEKCDGYICYRYRWLSIYLERKGRNEGKGSGVFWLTNKQECG